MFEVAFICTGNRARSPFAAELLRRHVVDLPVTVTSFGTLRHGPAPALPKARRAAREYGVDLTAHRSRPLAEGDLARRDLAIGFEPIHVASSVVVGGIARERAFLATELAEAIAVIPEPELAGSRPERLLALAHDLRARSASEASTIADPVNRGAQVFATTFEHIDRCVAMIAVLFDGLRSPGRVSADQSP